MHLKLEQLEKIAKRALVEERNVEALRNEITRVLGPIVNTDLRIDELAYEVNNRLSVMRHTGRSLRESFRPRIIMAFSQHTNPEVRRMVASLAPVKNISRFAIDKNATVRAAAARRMPVILLKEMVRRHPRDENVKIIYRERLAEAKEEKERFTPYDGDALGDIVKQQSEPELSDVWYKTKARDLINQHDTRMIDYDWEEKAVKNFCNHTKATSGILIDYDKLLKLVRDTIKDHDDVTLERDALKELAASLIDDSIIEECSQPVMPIFEEQLDEVKDLLESDCGSSEYVRRGAALFNVQESRIPAAMHKYRLGEGRRQEIRVPMKGYLPHGGTFRSIDERALDRFVESWSSVRAHEGEPLRLGWVVDPSAEGAIGFTVELK